MNGTQANRIVNVMLIIMVIVMLASIAGLGIMIRVTNELKQQAQTFHDQGNANLTIIKENQEAQTVAFKDYIACLLTLQPGPTLAAQEQACFNKAPMVKP